MHHGHGDLHHDQHHGSLVGGFSARSAFQRYSYDCDPHSPYYPLARCRPFGASFYGYGRYGYEWTKYAYGLGPIYGLGVHAEYASDQPLLGPEDALSPQGDPIEHRQPTSAPMHIPLVASPAPPDVLSDSTPEQRGNSAVVIDAGLVQQEAAQPED